MNVPRAVMTSLWLLSGATLGPGCVKAPEIVMVDRATALEEQAGGSFTELEQKLERGGIVPNPVPFSPEQLQTLGIKAAPLANDTELTEADKVDHLLRQHCVGEGENGLLVSTHDACNGAVERVATLELVERVNRARMQLWQWMRTVRAGATESVVREAWRKAHARGVVCGGWMEQPGGGWGAKKC